MSSIRTEELLLSKGFAMKKLLLVVSIVMLIGISCAKQDAKFDSAPAPNPPAMFKTSFASMGEGDSISTLNPQDPNVQSVILTEATSGRPAPNPLLIHRITGEVNWQAAIGDAGHYGVAFRATDPNGAFDEEVITITVTPRRNRPPIVFAKISKKRITNGL